MVRETAVARLWRSRSLSQRNTTLVFRKIGDSDLSSTKPEDATKKVANCVESVNNASGGSCTSREATSRNGFGPSPADFAIRNDFASQMSPPSDGPILAQSGDISENQTGTLPMKVDSHAERGRSTKQEPKDYWAFNPTSAGNKLREELKEEEDRKEREKEEKEMRRKRTKGQNKALAAFMKTTDPKNQTKEWAEKSLRSGQACPFCNRCFIIQLILDFLSDIASFHAVGVSLQAASKVMSNAALQTRKNLDLSKQSQGLIKYCGLNSRAAGALSYLQCLCNF